MSNFDVFEVLGLTDASRKIVPIQVRHTHKKGKLIFLFKFGRPISTHSPGFTVCYVIIYFEFHSL